MYVKYSMDDILHDNILLFSLVLFFVFISVPLNKRKRKKIVITRGQVEVTTERTRKCFSFFLS